MLLYLSAVASDGIYRRLNARGQLAAGYQVQRFNYSLLRGLSAEGKGRIVALSALPYKQGESADRLTDREEGIDFIAVPCRSGRISRKLGNITALRREGAKLLRSAEGEESLIICDAVSHAASAAAVYLSRKFGVPAIAIVTDLPSVMYDGRQNLFGRISGRLMTEYSGYILLTEAMNGIANPHGRPHMIMEGICPHDAALSGRIIGADSERRVIYAGSLWRKVAGIELLLEGFTAAAIPGLTLEFYGKGDLVPEIEAVSADHPSVKYMGTLDTTAMAARLREGELLVNPRPSDSDFCRYSFPSKTMDYMASGVPVLMTRLPGLPREYEDKLYFIEEETAEGVALALTRIFSLPAAERAARGEAARRFVLAEKNYRAQAARVLKFAETLKK